MGAIMAGPVLSAEERISRLIPEGARLRCFRWGLPSVGCGQVAGRGGGGALDWLVD